MHLRAGIRQKTEKVQSFQRSNFRGRYGISLFDKWLYKLPFSHRPSASVSEVTHFKKYPYSRLDLVNRISTVDGLFQVGICCSIHAKCRIFFLSQVGVTALNQEIQTTMTLYNLLIIEGSLC
jgi:hypothetical protein